MNMMTLKCPICKKEWFWGGERIPHPEVGYNVVYLPKPTRIKRATCPDCHWEYLGQSVELPKNQMDGYLCYRQQVGKGKVSS
jgi:hypothetical protein